jgi:biotin synthase
MDNDFKLLSNSYWDVLTKQSIDNLGITPEDGINILKAKDDDTFSIINAAYRVRTHFHGKKVRIHILQNAKSGECPEDCNFCAQSSKNSTSIETYPLLNVELLVEEAKKAKASGAWKYCMVTATRSPSNRDLDIICQATKRIKKEVNIKVCTSLGLLTFDKAKRLAEAGVDRFNHNLETSNQYFEKIVHTHTWDERWQTLTYVKEAGMEICSGGIIGMGESLDDILDLCFSLKSIGVASIPINFLNPRPNTPLEKQPTVDAFFGLRVLSLFRLVHPDKDIRAAGGREITFRTLQPLVLYIANSIFTNGYLTTDGQTSEMDIRMIKELGFYPEVN